MSVELRYGVSLTITETIETGVPYGSAVTVTTTPQPTINTYTGATTVPVTKQATFDKALSAGAGTIDLTALVGVNGAAVDFTDLKVQFAKFKNKAANANAITVTFGASNGYLLAGTAWKVILQPGQEVTFFGNDAAPDVDSTHKTIDLAGTLTQALEVILVAG